MLSPHTKVSLRRSARPAAVALFVLTVLAACSRLRSPEDESARAASTSIEAASPQNAVPLPQNNDQTQANRIGISSVAEASGVLTLPGRIALADDHIWRVGVRTDGLVVSVMADVGDYVRTGQVLARYRADEVLESRARYRAAQSELIRAQSALGLVQRNVDRSQRLLDLKAASVQQVERARQDVVNAETAVHLAELEVDRLRDLLEDDLRVSAEPSATDATADQVPILAPAAGYVLQRNITLGRAVDTKDETFVIGDLSAVWMLASVRQDQLGQLHAGEAVTVTVNGLFGLSFPGRITNLGQQLDPATHTMQVRVALRNPDNKLRPGMLANANVGRAIEGSEKTPHN